MHHNGDFMEVKRNFVEKEMKLRSPDMLEYVDRVIFVAAHSEF
jgi:hypothetical protein